MSNGEVQPQKTTEAKKGKQTEVEPTEVVRPVRKSKITKGIQRTLNTGKFESIVIYDQIEEEIEWSTPAERAKKVANWEMLLIENFKKTHDHIMTELGLEHKKAYFKDNTENKEYKGTDNGMDRSLDTLDTLD